MNPEIKPTDIIQINPEHDPRFGGCLMVVVRVTPDGPMGYIPAPVGATWPNVVVAGTNVERIRYICPFDQCIKVGQVEWIAKDELENKSSIPFVGFSGSRLAKCPVVKPDDSIECTICGKDHPLYSVDETDSVLFYACGEHTKLGALKFNDEYRCVVGIAPTLSGKPDDEPEKDPWA